MKICTKCKLSKPLDQFSLGNDPLGLKHTCKTCCAEYYIQNREKFTALRKAYNADHREEMLLKNSEWKRNNRARVREINDRRRAIKLGATIEALPPDLLNVLIEVYGPECMIPECSNIDPSPDHIVPLSKGGAHAMHNFQILCKHHNLAKGNRNSIDYRPFSAFTA